MTTTSPGRSLGTSCSSRNFKKTGAVVPPCTVIMASMPSIDSAASMVVTLPRLRGTRPNARRPLGAHARVRVIAMCEPDSSMKIKRSGSQAWISARKASRLATTSAVHCSAATWAFVVRFVTPADAAGWFKHSGVFPPQSA